MHSVEMAHSVKWLDLSHLTLEVGSLNPTNVNLWYFSML